jgi:hypothetical protein
MDRIEVSLSQEDVQHLIDAYEKDIEYIKQLEKLNKFLMERENKLQLIENMFKNEPVDLKELSKLVKK